MIMEETQNKNLVIGLINKIAPPLNRPNSFNLTDVLDYTPDSLSPLYEQFLSPKNRGVGFQKSVRQDFDDFEGLGKGQIIISDDKEKGVVTKWSPYMGDEFYKEENRKGLQAEFAMNFPLHVFPWLAMATGAKTLVTRHKQDPTRHVSGRTTTLKPGDLTPNYGSKGKTYKPNEVRTGQPGITKNEAGIPVDMGQNQAYVSWLAQNPGGTEQQWKAALTLQLKNKIDNPSEEQTNLFGSPEAESKNLVPFIVYAMKQDMPAYSKEVPEGYIDYHKMRNWFYSSETKGRAAIEAAMTPVKPGTWISRGVSFSGLRRAELPKLRRNFQPILKALGIDTAESVSIHHIAALKATFGILHKVQIDSPLFREVFDVLLEYIPGLGNMEGNLIPVVGRAKGKKQASTPHHIVHRFYAKKIGESGEIFFTDEVLEKMVASKEYRIEKARELGLLIARSEQIVKDAQKIWDVGFSQENIHFEEIVNRLSQLDELGYNKLLSTEFQTPALSEMIKDIVLDIKVEQDQLRRLTPQSEDFSDIKKQQTLRDAKIEEERRQIIKQEKNKNKKPDNPDQEELF